LRFQVSGEASNFKKLAHRLWIFREAKGGTILTNLSAREVNLNCIALGDCRVSLRAFDNRQAGVDGIPIERPRERARNDSFDSQTHDCCHRLFACAATAEVTAGHENIELAEPGREVVAQHFECMLGQLVGFDVNQISAGNDNVGVDVVSEFINLSLKYLFHGSTALWGPKSRL
jgi:hypothetical protein